MRSAIAFVALAAAACFPQPTVAQQEQDAAALANCVSANWGKPVLTVAALCTQDSVAVAEDVIADIEAAVEIAHERDVDAGGSAPSAFPYLDNPDIMTKVTQKKALHGGTR